MINKIYKIPIDLEPLMSDNQDAKTCSMAESIGDNILLLLTTRKRENRFDFDYGNAVWDLEFENAVSTVEWESIFIASMKEQLERYEPRIRDVKIAVHIEYVEHSYDTKRYTEIKKKAKIAVNALLTDSGEHYGFSTAIFLSPLSIV